MSFLGKKGEKGVKRSMVPIPTALLMVPSSCKGGGQHWTEYRGGWETIEDIGVDSTTISLKRNVGKRR